MSISKVIGDWEAFIHSIDRQLRQTDLNPLFLKCIDHLCYRCETDVEYSLMISMLVPRYGQLLTESIVGGRPISIIQLHIPLQTLEYSIPCLEIPSPKPGRAYSSGLEHVEFVIGHAGTAYKGEAAQVPLRALMASSRLLFDTRALEKEVNPDVSVTLTLSTGTNVQAKFHTQPLSKVICDDQL